uniref:Maternal B9.10 protein-like n=2 Tax=Gouania willdenowi TaxID=441366 RepID=A0A8C5EG25_GOUWI
MKEEIAAAVFFVARLVKRFGRLDADGRERFAAALTAVLLQSYKNHWHPNAPSRGQAYRCLRINHTLPCDPALQTACERSHVTFQDLGLPVELTLWVDPGRVSCRYGEHSTPFCVTTVGGCRRGNEEFSRRVQEAVERASLEVASESSLEEEEEEEDTSSQSASSLRSNRNDVKSIPTVSNPNSVYRFSEFSAGAPQTWLREKWKSFPESFPSSSSSSVRSYRASFTFSGPRVDKYHWNNKSRS